jgi:uncharacterized protein YozE (UPF0346 family)
MKYREDKVVDGVTQLANLVYEEMTFPKQSSDFDEISTYLELQATFVFNLSVFDEIWDSYLMYRK